MDHNQSTHFIFSPTTSKALSSLVSMQSFRKEAPIPEVSRAEMEVR
jgi:hypothetical protein